MFQNSVWKHQGVSKWGHGLPPPPPWSENLGKDRGGGDGGDELPHGVVLLRNRTFDSARAAPGRGRLSTESWHVRHSAWGLTNPGFGSVHSYIPRPMWTPRWWQDEKEQRGLLRERRAEFQETPPGTKTAFAWLLLSAWWACQAPGTPDYFRYRIYSIFVDTEFT